MNILSIAAVVALILIILTFMWYFQLEIKGRLNSSDDRKKYTGTMMLTILSIALLLCGFIIVHEAMVPRIPSQEQKAEPVIPPVDKKKDEPVVKADTSAKKPASADTTVADKKKVAKVPDPKKKPTSKEVVKKKQPSKPTAQRKQTRRNGGYIDPKNPTTIGKYDY